MTDHELERRLERAVSKTAPDNMEDVLSRCGAQKGTVIPMKKRTGRIWKMAAAACLALALLAGFGVFYGQANAVASVVSLDVNPSIELLVNSGRKVLACKALNEEAKAVLAGMDGGEDLKGAKLDVAVNAIVGALVRSGYLDKVSSAILISVSDKDPVRAERLERELVAAVGQTLTVENSAAAAVYGQTVTMDAGYQDHGTAVTSTVSAGKDALVKRVMEFNGAAGDDRAVYEKLCALSVEELSDLLKYSLKGFPIGRSAAGVNAEEYAGTAAMNSVTVETDPELDEPRPHYEVELHTAWGEFEYLVDAFTGEVYSGQANLLAALSTPKPVDPTPTQTPAPDPTPTPAQTADVGRDAALSAALGHAGVKQADAWDVKVEREYDHGRLEYEVEFKSGGMEYDYVIDGATGAVLKFESEWDD